MNMHNIFNFKSFFKFLEKNKLYTFIEVFGLSVSLMFVVLMACFTAQELTTDNFHENKDQLYFLASEESFGFAYRLAERIKDRYPEIEEVCPIINYYKKSPVKLTENNINADLLFADSTFFKMLSFQISQGNKEVPLAARNYAVISESFARRAFPGKDPLGQLLQLQDSVTLTVNAVMKDIRNSSIPYADIIVRIDNIKHWNQSLDSYSYDNYGTAPILVQAKPNTDLKTKEEDLLTFLKDEVWVYKKEGIKTVSFVPIKEAYFSIVKGYEGYLLDQGDRTFTLILLSVGILILIFAIINYINLTVAQTGFRAKEMATRRLLGSSRGELFVRLIIESSLLTFISFGIALFLCYLLIPSANNLLQACIDLSYIFRPGSILIAIAVLIIIGFLSGLLPAMIISNAQAIEVVKGGFRKKTKMVYSKVFITFQHIITIALVTAALVMVIQINYLIKAPLGYQTENIINLEVIELGDKQTILTLANEFKQLATTQQVAFCQGTPFDTGNNHSYSKDGKHTKFHVFTGDDAFWEMMGFEIQQENHVASDNAYYLSRMAINTLELTENDTSFEFKSLSDKRLLVAGIIKDFQLQNILYETFPVLLSRKKVEDFFPWNILIQTTGDPFIAYNDIKDTYERITGFEFTGKFIDQEIEHSFDQQSKTSKMLVLFAAIAILLSLLGLIAMSTYFIQQRSREIAVRKVFGSSISEVLRRLIFTFLYYVIIAFVIVTPAIWYIMQQWLEGYSYRISLHPWIFISSGLFCMFLSFITVFWQSYQAACMNPVVSIKME